MIRPTMTPEAMVETIREGLDGFAPGRAVYIRPMYWAIHGSDLGVAPSGEETGTAICLEAVAMPPPEATTTLTRTRFRRPVLEDAVCDAKAGCLYPNNARMLVEARRKGFGNALAADAMGNVAETATANVFVVRDGVAFTPVANGTFLAGITRARHIANLRADGIEVVETVPHLRGRPRRRRGVPVGQLHEGHAGDGLRRHRLPRRPRHAAGARALLGLGALGRLMRAVPLAATVAAAAWALSTNPLAAPFVDRAGRDLALALERAVRLRADAAWIEAALASAVAAGDADRAAMLLGLARDLGRDVARADAEALVAGASGWGATAKDCVACMADTAACRSARALAACAVPFELSPLGDVNALRRAGLDLATGGDVDGVEVGLAAVGLGATAALVATGGGSAAMKAGAGLMRMARRMGTLPPSIVRLAQRAATDPAARRTLAAVAGDMARMRAAVGTGAALRLARYADGPEDAARLARVAEATGPRAERTLAVLGKSRAFRATVRLSRAAAATLALLWLCAVQLAVLLGTRAGALLARAAARAGG